MSRASKEPEDLAREEAELLAELGEALGQAGELPPISDEEVRAFERQLVDPELPEGLAEYRGRGALIDLEAVRQSRTETAGARGGWVSHLVAVTLGAAAATALFMSTEQTSKTGSLPSGEPLRPQPDAEVDAGPRIHLALPDACAAPCCAGSRCEKLDLRSTPPAVPGSEPGASLKTCSSGRSCVSCDSDEDARYRVRTGGFIPTESGKELIKGAKPGQLALCFRGGSSAVHCVDAHPGRDEDQSWRDLPLVVGGSDLVGGLSVELRYRGAKKPLGTWQSPLKMNPTLLCNGLAVRVKDDKGDLIGSLSAFFMDTHYVELGRARSVSELQQLSERFELSGIRSAVFQLAGAAGEERFNLALGPLSEAQAEDLRWQVLEQGGVAKVTMGAKHEGKGHELRARD